MQDRGETSEQFLIVNGIIKEDDKILLVKRQREWDEQAHGKWELPGGKVEFDEEPKEAVVREVKEETGFEVKDPKLMSETYSHAWEYESRKSHVVILPYLCELEGGSKDSSDKNIQEVKWFTREEIEDLDCLPGTEQMLDYC